MVNDPTARFLLKLLDKRERTEAELIFACPGFDPEPTLRRLYAEQLILIDHRPGVPPADRIYGLTQAGEQYVAALQYLPAN